MEPAEAAILGAVLGGVIGGLVGFAIWRWMLPASLIFPGDIMVASALICAIPGYVFGEPFVEFLLAVIRSWPWLP